MGHGEFEDERGTFEGIASKLLSFAVLAEFLCVLPLVLRLPVLSLLRPAEAVARAFAVEWAGRTLALPPAAFPGTNRDSCAEALRLARCFRALASIFAGLHGLAAGRSPFRGGPLGRLAQGAPAVAWRSQAMQIRRAMAFRERIDTS